MEPDMRRGTLFFDHYVLPAKVNVQKNETNYSVCVVFYVMMCP